jgi:hypothetical protein
MRFRRHPAAEESAQEKWLREHPYGEPESVEYWIESMKRAYQLGEVRALPEMERLEALTGPQPPRPLHSFPGWFTDLWIGHLAAYNHDSSQYAMPY